MNASPAVQPVSPKTSLPSSGTTVRSWPSIPATSALTATRRKKQGKVLMQPQHESRLAAGVVHGLRGHQPMRPSERAPV